MIEAHVDVTPEPFIVQNDKVRVFKKQKGRRRAPKGLVCDFSFSCARVVSCTDHQQQPGEAGRWILLGARTGPGAQGPGRGSRVHHQGRPGSRSSVSFNTTLLKRK